MKFYILLHNQISMANATILNSPEHWFPYEIEEVQYQLKITVENYHLQGHITDYQKEKLLTLIDGINYKE